MNVYEYFSNLSFHILKIKNNMPVNQHFCQKYKNVSKNTIEFVKHDINSLAYAFEPKILMLLAKMLIHYNIFLNASVEILLELSSKSCQQSPVTPYAT